MHHHLVRNAYILIDYGDFIGNDSRTAADPYIQLLALTNDTTETHQDFVRVRGGASDGKHFNTRLLVTVLVVAAAALLLGAALWGLMRHRRNRSAGVQTGKPWGAAAGSYYPLGAPAPHAAAEVHQGGGQHVPYQQPYDAPNRPPPGGEADEYYNAPVHRGQGGYTNPFEDRR